METLTSSFCILYSNTNSWHLGLVIKHIFFFPRASGVLPSWPQRSKGVTVRPGLQRQTKLPGYWWAKPDTKPAASSEICGKQWGLFHFRLLYWDTETGLPRACFLLLPTEIQPRLRGPEPGPTMPHPSLNTGEGPHQLWSLLCLLSGHTYCAFLP